MHYSLCHKLKSNTLKTNQNKAILLLYFSQYVLIFIKSQTILLRQGSWASKKKRTFWNSSIVHCVKGFVVAVAVFEVGFIRGGLGNKHTEKKLVLVSRDRTRTTTIYIKGNDLLLTPLPSSILRQFVLLTNLLLNFYSHTTIEMALFTYFQIEKKYSTKLKNNSYGILNENHERFWCFNEYFLLSHHQPHDIISIGSKGSGKMYYWFFLQKK